MLHFRHSKNLPKLKESHQSTYIVVDTPCDCGAVFKCCHDVAACVGETIVGLK